MANDPKLNSLDIDPVDNDPLDMDPLDIDPLDWSTIRPVVDRLLAAQLTAENAGAWLREWSRLEAALEESSASVERAVSENTADKAAEARFLHHVEDIRPKARVAEQALRDKLLAVADFEPNDETRILWRRFRADADLFRPENVPLQTELDKQANDYAKIAGAMEIQWDGTNETLPQAAVHLMDPNRETRERAWHLIMDRWQQDRERLNNLYLNMLSHRRRLAQNAGKPDFRAYQWEAYNRFDYSPADCYTFHDAIEHEVVPVARQINQELAHRLGLESLRPWDTDVDPYGAPLKPFKTTDELEAGAQRMFEQVDPELAQHFAAMRAGWLDLASRPNKAPGGYCSSFPISRRPYIFANTVGTQDDVQTLLHEGGHAFHFMESLVHPLVWNTSAPTEFAEVASMGMELLAAPYLERDRGGFYDGAEARRAYTQQLESIVRFLPYMAVVDAFQHWVYTAAPEDVTAGDLDAKWSESWDRFMQGVDWGGLQAEKETGWHRKLHIFQIPFYYVEYGLAQLGALQVWRNALQNQKQAVAGYRTALALGYTRSLPELFAAAGARFAFDRQTVGDLMHLVTDQLARLKG